MKVENRIEIYHIPDRVICQICGNWFRSITETHLSRHGLNLKEYRKMFPKAHVFCAESRKKVSKSNKDFMKKHPELKPPKSRLKELRKNQDFMEKCNYHNALVQGLPYRKEVLAEQFFERKDKLFSKEALEKRSKTLKKLWKEPEFRKSHTGESHGNYGRIKSKKERENISNGRKNYWKKIRGTDNEVELKKRLSDGHKKSMVNNPYLIEKIRETAKKGRKIKIEKRKAIKESLMPEIIKLREQGMTYEQIAENYDVSMGTIYNWLNDKNLYV